MALFTVRTANNPMTLTSTRRKQSNGAESRRHGDPRAKPPGLIWTR